MASLSTPAKVGLLALACLVALSVIIIWKTEIFMVKEGYELTGSFDSIEGLTIGSEIRYRGLRVGKVMKLDPGPTEIKIYGVVNRNIRFPRDSILRVAYDGIVGQKYLEIKPGSSEAIYAPPAILYGQKTAGIVDFVDIGSQSLVETKKILENIHYIVANPRLQQAIFDTVFTAEKLTTELRQTNQGIRDIVADPRFQEDIKGTIGETKKTLSSANKFFDSIGKMNLRASAGVDIGSTANAVRGDIDIIQNENNYFRFGLGEGPSRQPSLLDMLFNSRVNDKYGFRLGLINNQIGGGVALYPTEKVTWRGDIYDVNNPRPNWPKIRLGYEYALENYMDVTVKADDILNSGSSNVTLGIRVKPPGIRMY